MGENYFHRHQKKVLALVLAFACAFTMFAGAAFTDAADINSDNVEAVDTLVALGVINGYTDGSFQPNGTITRAEMAKMIYVLRTGSDNADAYKSTATKFTDLNTSKSSWAAGYIKYCEALGIIAGKSATKFDPDNTVTGEEAAKMLLVTLGYNAETAKLVGTGWAQRTTALADENGLLDGVTAPLKLALPREWAAKLMFNAVDAYTVKLTDGEYSNMNIIGTYYPTIGEKYMGLKKTIGTLNSVLKTDGKDTYEVTITNPTSDSTGGTTSPVLNFKAIEKDYSSLKYQQVKVLYKEKDKVYGIYATKDNESSAGLLADLKMDGSKVKLGSDKYDLDATTSVYVDGVKETAASYDEIAEWVTDNAEGKVNAQNSASYGKGAKVELLSTDGNTKMDTLRVTTFSVEKVTYVGKDYINAGGVKKDEDWNYPSDVKKDDYVVVSSKDNYADGKGLIEKAESVEGKVTATKGSDQVTISGTWYKMNTGVTAPRMNATVKLILVNGFAYEVTTVTAGTSDVALVAEVKQTSGVGSVWQARVIFADGSDKVVTVDEVDGADPTTKNVADGFLATYTVSKDKYSFTTIDTTEKAGYANLLTGTGLKIDGKATGTMDLNGASGTHSVYFDGNTVAFVRSENDKYKVVKGTDVKNWKETTGVGLTALAEVSSGNNYAKIAYIDLNTTKVPGGSDKTYAVALDSSYTENIDGTTYTMIKAWNGTEETVYKIDGSLTFAKGDVFEYSVDSEGVADVTKLADDGATNEKVLATTQVTSYDEGTGDIGLLEAVATGSKSKIDSKDTVVLYVDSDAKIGVGDGEVQVAEDTDGDGNKENNVTVYSEKDEDQILVIVVDVNNNMDWS
ncbi:S-layer homology domain-containing protein [Agathobaculum sp.]|uniref:S-layer homology domain-containing protein n=1 Tax=Agathobaculum sp. TaxID=2048138 RepID=UPI002A7F864F|nr:S-layer homology domain-containing protein [Agathobaculum sp.]MDY3617393.1 S-layer homology domain-containing protein [Agathobaculum sp.]